MATKYIPKHFTPSEFEKLGCSIDDIDPNSLRALDYARSHAGIPFILTSAYRSKESELAKGRTGNSAHTRGRAFDIACSSDRQRFLIIRSCIVAGFTRIGIAKTYVHVDNDYSCLPSPRVWLY